MVLIEKIGKNLEMETSWTILISALAIIIMISLISLCFFCKRKTPKSELMGIEGNVKLRNDEYSTIVSIDNKRTEDQSNQLSKISIKNATLPADVKLNGPELGNELKRSTNPPHRSLPDIPSIPTNEACDNNSELYATVGDKVQDKSDGKSPSETQKHSQHSSISQADDPSSPYAHVRSPPHAYDKLKRVEHPYAQVVQPGTKGGSIAQVVLENDDDDDEDENENSIIEDPISHRDSSQNLLNSENIPAASAIAGRISASQELPYMTPPIVQPPAMQQHFSGDSQDSKGYTSISVREPLANIRAQTNQQNVERRRRDREMNDSHYATVSDDSDEMYAAIEDAGDYTSGSETYAQIQPQPITVSVSVEINQSSANSAIPSTSNRFSNRFSSASNHIPIIEETAHDTLRVNIHSRQASSSSCTSSVGNIGSPKIEKRMGPLPPTPNQMRPSSSTDHRDSNIKDSNNNTNKMKQSPSKDLKDLEEMYAKVMKKNKLSNLPSENSSPIMNRKSKESTPGLDMPDCSNDVSKMFSSPNKQLPKIPNDYETIEKKRDRSKDEAGYEIIPADRNNNGIKDKNVGESSKAKMSLFQNEPGYESLPDRPDDPNYETLKNFSDYDPNYEIVIPNANLSSSSSTTLVDDGYSQIAKKTKDLNDGYSSIRTLKNQMDEDDEDEIPGYSSIKEKKEDDHGYSTLKDPNEANSSHTSINKYEDGNSLNHHYASIPPLVPALNTHLSAENRKTPISETTPSTDSNSSEVLIDYDIVRTSTSNSLITPTNAQEKSSTNSNYESLSNSESNTEDPNYESMKYLDVKEDNPYERLHSEKNSPEPKDDQKPNPEVGDFFQV